MRIGSLRRSIVLAAGLSLALAGQIAGRGPTLDDGVVDQGRGHHGVAHHQHGGTGGHITVSNYNVDLVSKLELTSAQDRIADVSVWNGFAYLGAFRQDACSGPESLGPDGGVYIVDIQDPENPVEAGFVAIHQDSYAGEGIHVTSITTRSFSGDLLGINAESCGPNDKGGFTLVDVSNPYRPVTLVRHFGDFRVNIDNPGRDANDIHSLFMWEDDKGTPSHADDRAYIAIVDDLELTDFDVFDITDPRKPRLVGEWDLDAAFPGIVDPVLGDAEGFLHDLIVKKVDGDYVALLSYWDSGYVLLNVNDPANPQLIGDSDYDDPDPVSGEVPEGNAHQAEFTRDNRYIVAADEDFTPYPVDATNVTDSTSFVVTSGTDTPEIPNGTTLIAETVFVGRACDGDPAVPVAPTTTSGKQIALVERGLCTFTEKVANVEAAGGYEAVIVFNRQGSDGCSTLILMDVEGTIPALFVDRETGFDFLDLGGYDETACRAGTGVTTASVAIGTIGDTLSFESYFDGWGYVRLYDADPVGGKLVELDQYAIPEAFDPSKASGFGDLSVHEVAASAVADDIVYLSYYSGGLRILQIVADALVEVGAFIDTDSPGGNNFWGVEVFQHDGQEYVAASDRDFGLYIFRYDPAP